jgi:hypothetical protein
MPINISKRKYMKLTNGNFKLSKTAKRMLALISDPVQRGHTRRATVAAEYAASIKPKAKSAERT